MEKLKSLPDEVAARRETAKSTAQRSCSSLSWSSSDAFVDLIGSVVVEKAKCGRRMGEDEDVKGAASSVNSMHRTELASKMSDTSVETANL